ncbi:MAG TPA: DUF1800 domain-containing protein [Steroidobacteraceae bacterium]|nr:DUF1800 domain-containing protein [Steroidobacteraceae bacterium]
MALGLISCGGGSSGTTAPPATVLPTGPLATRVEAFRFLNQSTLGATETEAQRFIALGDSSTSYPRWIDAELAKPASVLLPAVEAAYPNPVPTGFNIASLNAPRVEKWFDNALNGSDQLRQRVAWALSQIFVVSQVGALQNLPNATADFYDMLARDAFGDYRKLLEDVTLHPAMGVYLSMLGNQKAVAGTNLRPDENYAREVMQLMSIGLVELNLDGSVKLDGGGQPISTYDQSIIEGFARVFTGWNWSCQSTLPNCTFTTVRPQLAPVPGYNQVQPMKLYAAQHETGTKKLLSGVTLPASQTGERDLQDALDNIAAHPNVAPFISRQLIQKLVTSNPSAAYVQRVAQVFNNDGTGRRGNLGAVVRAILLDSEARPASSVAAPPVAPGKVKEPLLRLTQFWRAYGARAASGKTGAGRNFPGGVSAVFGQGPGLSPSVFNFYSPGFAPPGEIQSQGMVAPEMQLATEYLNTQATNFFWQQANARTVTQAPTLNADDMYIDTSAEIALAADSEALVNRVAERLLGSADAMSAVLKTQVKAQVDRSATTSTNTRVADAIYLIAVSPDYMLQR